MKYNYSILKKFLDLWENFNTLLRKIYSKIRWFIQTHEKMYAEQEKIAEWCGCSLSTVHRAIKRLSKGGFIKVINRGANRSCLYELTRISIDIDFFNVDEYYKKQPEKHVSFASDVPVDVRLNNKQSSSRYKNVNTREDVGKSPKKNRSIVFSEKENELLEERRRTFFVVDERFQSLGTYFSKEMMERWKIFNSFEKLMRSFDLLQAEMQRRMDEDDGLLGNAEAWFQSTLSPDNRWKMKKETSALKERNRRKAFSGIRKFIRWIDDHYALFANGVKVYFNASEDAFDREFENQKTINTWG